MMTCDAIMPLAGALLYETITVPDNARTGEGDKYKRRSRTMRCNNKPQSTTEMKLTLVIIAALASAVAAKQDVFCCRAVKGVCPLPGEVLPRDAAILTPRGYLDERTGTLMGRKEASCCVCLVSSSTDCAAAHC